MKIQRTIPPAAAPIYIRSLLHGMAGILSSKKYLAKIENELREYFGVKHVFLVSSGKAALFLILQSLKSLSPGKHQVLIPAYTCFSVPSAIVKTGLKVSLCDIEPSTFDFDYRLLERTINERTLCVIPDHLFGIPSDLDRINSLCKTRGIFVVEDAAQAMGSSYRGRLLGTIGDVGFFSLGRGKNITCGSGGVIITSSKDIGHLIQEGLSRLENPGVLESIQELGKVILMSFFIHPSLYWVPSGLPFLKLGETKFDRGFSIKKLSRTQVGLLKNWKLRLEESNRVHKQNARYFHETLGLKKGSLQDVSYLRLPLLIEGSVMHERNQPSGAERRVGISAMYPSPINEIEQIRDQFKGSVFPSAKFVAERLMTLPTHKYLSNRDKEEICRVIQQSTFGNHEAEDRKQKG